LAFSTAVSGEISLAATDRCSSLWAGDDGGDTTRKALSADDVGSSGIRYGRV